MTVDLRSTATIRTPEGRWLRIRPQDQLWLLRAVEAEGAPREMVAQALVNRWAYLVDHGYAQHFPTLASLVRAYAQPVNPRWYPGGDLHTGALERGQDTEARARTRRDVHSTRSAFAASTRAAVRRAMLGQLTLPPGVVHYSVPRDSDDWKRLEIIPGERGRTNAFYAAEGSEGYLYTPIKGHSPRGGRSTLAALGVLLAAAVVTGGVVLYRAKKSAPGDGFSGGQSKSVTAMKQDFSAHPQPKPLERKAIGA